MMMISIATLSVILFCLGIVQIFIFFLLAIRHNHLSGIKTCVVGYLVMTLGAISLYQRYWNMDSSFYVVVSNLAIVVGIALVYKGVSSFLGTKVSKTPVCVLAAYLLEFLYFTYVDDNMKMRIILFSFSFSIFLMIIAAELLFGRKTKRLNSTKLLGVTLSFGGLFFLIRGILSIFSVPINNFFDPSVLQVAVFFVSFIISYIWSFGLLIMIFERVNMEKNDGLKKFQVIYDTIPDMICISEIDGGAVIEANDRFIEAIGQSKQDVIGKNVFEILIYKSEQARQEFMDLMKRDGRIENVEADIQDKGGKLLTGLISGRLIDYNGKTHILSIIRDINIRKSLEHELRLQAQTDMLTSVANRRYFFERLESEILHSKTTMHESVFMMIDIDRFKNVNDTFGHAIGDAAIKMVAVASKSVLRTSDLFGRVGGDEFGVLLVNTDVGEAEKIAEKISENVQNIELFDNEGARILLHISVGISKFHIDQDSIEEMLARADKALYEAKDAGGNRVVALW